MAAWASGALATGSWASGAWAGSGSGPLAWEASAWVLGAWAPGTWVGIGSPPPPEPTDYTLWLSEDNRQRVLLVEAQAYSGGAVVTRYMASYPFVSEPSDTPANTPYDDIVTSTPWFTSRIEVALSDSGRSIPAWGDVEISNENGVRDSWLEDAWDGRAVSFYYGDERWSKSQYQQILAGTISDIYVKAQNVLALRVRDKQWKLNVPVQTNLIGGSTANAGQVVPLCFGDCYNVEPVLIDSALLKYQVHDGAILSIPAVYDNGVSVAYTADAATGTFTLAASPAGRITCDVRGAQPSGVYLTTCSKIVEHLVLTRSLLTTDDRDASSFAVFHATCPQTLGLYIRDRENLLDVLDKLVSSVGGWYSFTREGKMIVGRLDSPEASAQTLDLEEDDLVERQLTCHDRRLPVQSVRIGYKKNWTIQEDVAGAVSDDRRAELRAPHLIVTTTNVGVLTAHPLALEPDVVETLIANPADAQAEATRRASLFSVPRAVYVLEAFATPFATRVGQVVRLTHRRFGFEAGQKAVVVGIAEDPLSGIVRLEIWR